MNRIFEALQPSTLESGHYGSGTPAPSSANLPAGISQISDDSLSLQAVAAFPVPCSPEKRLVAISDRVGIGAEKLRILSAQLRYTQHKRSIKKLLVTSTVPGEGKTTIAANVAITLAQQRQKVLLVDGDLHKPALGTLLDLTSRPGLCDWWRQKRKIGDFLCRAEALPLWVLPAGYSLEQPLTVLQSPEIAQLIGSVSSWFDWVIIDSPPLVPLADARTWGTIVDCILVVSRRALTPRKLLQQNLATVEKSKILGVVLNDADSDAHRYYAHYYKQSAGNGKTEPTPRPKFEGTSA